MDPSMFAQLGTTGLICVVLIWVIIDQRATIRDQRQELRENAKVMLEQVVPLATRMLDALRDAGDIVKASATRERER